jgi:hypothetical protein
MTNDSELPGQTSIDDALPACDRCGEPGHDPLCPRCQDAEYRAWAEDARDMQLQNERQGN